MNADKYDNAFYAQSGELRTYIFVQYTVCIRDLVMTTSPPGCVSIVHETKV